MRRLFLSFSPTDDAAGGWAALHDLRGGDEEAVVDTDTAAAIALLDRLLVDVEGAALQPGEACKLTASDRDRMLAAIHASEFGERLDCVLHCDACEEPFDIDFHLPDLLASLALPPAHVAAAKPAVITLADGRRVRLPRGSDELALLGLPPEAARRELLARCMIDGEADLEDAAVLDALEHAAPLLDVDLDATCPECGTAVRAHFDLQHYLLTAIRQDAPSRTAEIHLIASTYGWSLGEILGLARQRRRAFARTIERERGAHAGAF